jgi:uncharacterized protein (TIGR02598 family)
MFTFPYRTSRFYAERRQRAFSLLEVTIAMGVLSVCLLTTLGLLPVGLNTMRSAMDCTVNAQIVQRITSEATLTAFINLDSYISAGPYYFDQEGQKAASPSLRRFAVSLSKVDLSTTPIFPGSQYATNLTSDLYAIQAVITDARSTKSAEPPATYIIYIPNSGG